MTRFKKSALYIGPKPSLLIMLFLLSACASTQSQIPSPEAIAIPLETSRPTGNMSWWACRFKMSWPPDTPADGAVDLLLAHAVVEPVLKEHEKNILWWRFHRRALRDKVGHQFSFLFYADSEVATEIMNEIRQSDILQKALEGKLVEKTIFSNPAKPLYPKIEAMSDPHWPESIQRNWPSFIMGVSTLWLGLIDDQMANVATKNVNISGLLETYRQADTAITSMWRKEGQHAFLHHLSAIFGYEPLQIRKNIRF